MGRFCQGSPGIEPKLSTGNQMFVKFHPGQMLDRGFEAEFSILSRPTAAPSSTISESPTTSGKSPLLSNYT